MNESLPSWMSDDIVKDIPENKLLFLNEIFNNPSLGNQKNMLLYLPKLLKRAKAENLLFTQDEFNRCVTAIRSHSNAEEAKNIDKILNKYQEVKENKNP